jgi:Golgi nucleoside diphosphatase
VGDRRLVARLLAGEQRAAYDWLTLNYLSGKLGAAPANTLTAVDLGGTAVQEAFALTPAEARAAPASYVMSVAAAGSKYSLYVNR